ncbi:MAG: hypothetical protein ACWGHO_01010 [Candidatus Moraniibacteriota bacterium]
MNFIQTEMTWPEGMKGLQNGMRGHVIPDEDIVADAAEKISKQTCGARRGMEGVTNGMVILDCKKGSSI